ncbi:MAG: hypothetical protein HQ579_02085 [Candidatus Omnitrophica bacterium]|nr:hypothetical protein [Candidatus Omnitrophota bacterium]
MLGLLYIAPVIVIVIISAIVVKVATVALKLTGMEDAKARFQALSAFTGTGFTTKDSELIVENRTRQKIVMVLMILGNAGLITVITALIFSFEKSGATPALVNSAVLILVLFLLYKLATHKRLTRILTKKIEDQLEKGPIFQKRPVEEIVHIAKDYGIAEVTMKEKCNDLGKSIMDSSFREKDILILAIERKSGVIPAPKAEDVIRLGDTLICYGRLNNIEKIITDQ